MNTEIITWLLIWLVILASWIFIAILGWWKFYEERRKSSLYHEKNMGLTMENYNLNVRLSKIIPFKEKRI